MKRASAVKRALGLGTYNMSLQVSSLLLRTRALNMAYNEQLNLSGWSVKHDKERCSAL